MTSAVFDCMIFLQAAASERGPAFAYLELVESSAVAVLHEIPDSGLTLRDPDDVPYVNLAIAAGVEFIVTRDNDLLEFAKDQTFRARCPQLRIMEPVAFLAEVRARRSST